MNGITSLIILVKALIMGSAVLLLAAAEPFWHQLLLVLISASVTAIGMVTAALVSTRKLEASMSANKEILEDIHVKQQERRTDDKV